MEWTERVRGGLLGLLVGDALGVPYEFHDKAEIPALDLIEFTPPDGFERAHVGVPPGTWSDDGAQALCLLASLLDRGRLDLKDLGQRFLDWRDRGYLAVDGNVFDIGITTAKALDALRGGAPPDTAGPADTYSNGNGSLMRVLTLALWHTGEDAELIRDAFAQSLVTHGHPRSQVCCAVYCLWARCLLEEADTPWSSAVERFRSLYPTESLYREELEWQIRPDDTPEGTGSGYVVDSLRSARQVMAYGSYEQVIRQAIALGRDTDTTACIAGGLAGIRGGRGEIPKRWQDQLRGKELLEPLMAKLIEHRRLA